MTTHFLYQSIGDGWDVTEVDIEPHFTKKGSPDWPTVVMPDGSLRGVHISELVTAERTE